MPKIKIEVKSVVLKKVIEKLLENFEQINTNDEILISDSKNFEGEKIYISTSSGFYNTINLPVDKQSLVNSIKNIMMDSFKSSSKLTHNEWELNIIENTIKFKEKKIKISNTEALILAKIWNKSAYYKDLIEIIGYKENIETQALKQHLGRIKRKIKALSNKDIDINFNDSKYFIKFE